MSLDDDKAHAIPRLIADRLKGRLARGSIHIFALNIIRVGLNFLITLFLARQLGVGEFGAYAFAMAWMTVLVVPATLGLDTLVVREFGKLREREAWPSIRAILRRTLLVCIVVSFLLAVLSACTVIFLPEAMLDPSLAIAVVVASLFLPILAVNRLRQAMLQGIGKFVASQAPDSLVQPLAMIAIVTIAVYLFGWPLRSTDALIAYGLSALLAGVMGYYLLWRSLPVRVSTHRADGAIPGWSSGVAAFFVISGASVLNLHADTLMLGFLSGSESAGTYRVVSQLVFLVSFPLMAVNAVIAPTLSACHGAGDRDRLQRTVTLASRAILAASLPVIVILVLAREPILTLFGPAYLEGASALVILLVGHAINVACGPVGQVLNMSGCERMVAKTLVGTALLNIILNAVLIPTFGIVGAASATAFTMSSWNIGLLVYCRIRLKIDGAAFGLKLHRKRS
jgi:O-antigen/teichoic acid export membrane protein